MTKQWHWIATALGVFGCCLAAESAWPAAAKSPIAIGLIEPYSGQEAAYGEWVDDAWKLAMKNYGDTIDGHPIELVRGDSKCEPAVAVSAARQVFARQPAVLMAPVCSADTLAILPTIRALQIPTLSDNIAPKVTEEGGGWIWRVQITDSVMTPPEAEYIISQGCKRIGVIHDTTAPGQANSKDMIDSLTAGGHAPVAVASYALSDTDYSGPLLKLKAANLDCLFISAYDAQGGRLIRQAKQLGFTMPMYGNFSMFDEIFIKTAGPAGDGLVGVTSYLPDWSDASKKFDQQWVEQFHYGTHTDVAALYEMAVATIVALRKAPEARGKALNSIIAHTEIPNLPMGRLTFDSTGNNATPLVLLVTWKDQKLHLVKVLRGEK
ncbi:MAG: ABC transporter substrate-binding protein [Acetobacteraceae bacterium]